MHVSIIYNASFQRVPGSLLGREERDSLKIMVINYRIINNRSISLNYVFHNSGNGGEKMLLNNPII
jgi:hypothetical protein